MVCQSRTRDDDRRDYTKHMLRLRHASQINGTEANEIILLNSHDGTSSYQMLAGMFRFVCQNDLVCGDTFTDVRVPHKGNVPDHVIESAYEVLHGFEQVEHSRDAMRAITLDDGEAERFAKSALSLKYGESSKSVPVSESRILRPRRFVDNGSDLWSIFNRVQENLVKGGLTSRNANGRQWSTRPVHGIDQNIRLNRALWLLAESMRSRKLNLRADRAIAARSASFFTDEVLSRLLANNVCQPHIHRRVIRLSSRLSDPPGILLHRYLRADDTHSIGMPAALITTAKRASSERNIAANSSGVAVRAPSVPSMYMRSFTSGRFCAQFTDPWISRTIASGVRAGANTPYQLDIV